ATTNTVLENCTIECACSHETAYDVCSLLEFRRVLFLSNCTIRSASGNGLTIYGSDPRVLGCTFANNTNFALAMRVDSLPTLRSRSEERRVGKESRARGGAFPRRRTWEKDRIHYGADR